MLELAVVGMGGWGKRLVESVQGKSDRVRFRSAVVARPEKSKEFAQKHGLALGNDYASVLADPNIAGVVCSGPADLHAEHAIAGLKAGKHALVIKPMAGSLREALAVKAAADAAGRMAVLGYNRCFCPNVLEMRKRIAAGHLGRLLHTEGNFCVDRYGGFKGDSWKADPEKVTAGSLADHMLYLTIETLGSIAEVHTISQHDVSPNGLADTAAMLLRTKGNATALLTAIGVTADFHRFQVFGTKGWIEITGARQFTFQPIDGKREDVTLPDLDAERAEVEAFADAVEGRRPFPVPLDDAVHGVAVLEALGRSSREGVPVNVG